MPPLYANRAKAQPFHQAFARAFARHAKHYGLRTADLAAILGVTSQCASQYRKGHSLPRIEKLALLAEHPAFPLDAMLAEALAAQRGAEAPQQSAKTTTSSKR